MAKTQTTTQADLVCLVLSAETLPHAKSGRD